MYVGESQTITSEAAVLGVPALKCNTFARRLSIPNELENRFGLCYSFIPEEFGKMLEKIDELLALPDLKSEWQKRRQKMLSEKIDVTAFLVWFVENYPESVSIMKTNPDYQYRFR
jgi:predicted glycosyltransferase